MLTRNEFGSIVDVDVGAPVELEQRRKILEKGDACEREEGESMLERQVICYEAALRGMKMLIKEARDAEVAVDEETVQEYEGSIRGKEWTGREEVS